LRETISVAMKILHIEELKFKMARKLSMIITTKKLTSMLIATILLTGLLGALGQSANATPSPIVLISGNGVLGTPDPTITMLVGPANSPFNVPLVPADFTSAIAGPPAQIVTPLDAFWFFNPGPNGEQWIADSVGSGFGGTTGLYAQPFTVDCILGVDSASLVLDYSVDDHLGDAFNEGLFVNGNPVIGSKDLAFGNWAINQQSGPFDITSDVLLGANHLFVYQADTGGPAGIQYSATITYECETGIEKEFVDEVGMELPELLPVKSEIGTTMVWFTIKYQGSLANVTDNVPSEWDIDHIEGPSENDCEVFQNGKGNQQKSSTKIFCEDVTEVDLLVKLNTRESPSNSKGNSPNKVDKWKPTSCGTVFVNDGAYAFTLEDGIFTLLVNVGPLWLTAAVDPNVPSTSDCDDDGILDHLDACPDVFDDGTDTDSDGVPDACDNAPDDPNSRQADFDKDGVGDVADQCPFSDPKNSGPIDGWGCDTTQTDN